MNSFSSKHLIQHDATILLSSFAILTFLLPIGGKIDQFLIRPWINSAGQFYLNDNWYLNYWNHDIFKYVLIVIYACFLFLWILSFFIEKLKSQRFLYGYMFLMSSLSTALIGFIKSQSSHACPIHMLKNSSTGFIWDFSATDGQCFPGGHASTGFALISGFFVYRLSQHKRAKMFLMFGLGIGFILGWGQMMRGQHFLSHNLWTAWFIYAFNSVVFAVLAYKFPEKLSTSRNDHSYLNLSSDRLVNLFHRSKKHNPMQ
ncbi:phosphatase PAP2 family protein [Acinetobacter rudis]|uniref:Phosphatase PAP2 family protein n=1 Tax=Acinetobacter rudis TaxID=632955 RepID=A0AAW8JB36_9GAMM|nr:phosphatase PAP2 family protein [Acinetobacter rudis]MDQ8936793.1 phosphatase PAP2 family protein [Acinetobacter rudis]MDQ9019025.1 phosphatase PAP2 family protein [Acinetobacter rudis]